MIALLDTNVLIRFLTHNKDTKYKKLYTFFESLELGEMRIELKLIVLFQVIFVLNSFYRVPKEQIVDGLMHLLKYKGITIKEKKDDRIHVFITLALKRKKATPCLTKNHRKLLVQSLFV